LVIAAAVGAVALVGIVGALALSGGGESPEPQASATPTTGPTQSQSASQTASPTGSPTQSPSPSIDQIPTALVRAPFNLRSAATTSSSIRLTWTPAPNGGEAVRFQIFRDGKRVGQTAKETFLDDNLPPSTSFVYQVMAVGTDGSTAPSNEASLATAAASSGGSSSGGSSGGGSGECTILDQLAGKC